MESEGMDDKNIDYGKIERLNPDSNEPGRGVCADIWRRHSQQFSCFAQNC